MFANRFTAFLDACVLVGALKRNLLLSLAGAGFFRVRWSQPVIDEAERGIERTLEKRQRVADDLSRMPIPATYTGPAATSVWTES